MRSIPFMALLLVGACGGTAQAQESADFTHPYRFQHTEGKDLYRSLCQGCHMPDGQGAEGAGRYPALAKNPNLEYPEYSVHLILNGRNAMPGFARRLNDDQVAAIVDYVRTHFGNAYEGKVDPASVKDAR